MKSSKVGRLIKKAIIDMPADRIGKWTQSRLAIEIDTDKDILSKALNGKAHITFEMLSKICNKLDCMISIDIEGGSTIVINPNGLRSYK